MSGTGQTEQRGERRWRRFVRLLRDLHAPDYLAAKVADVGAFSSWATAITGVFVASTWLWDYAIDPVHMPAALGLRMGEAAAVLLLALVMHRSPAGTAARIGLFLVPLWVQLSFIEILARLEGGPSYGMGGFLYFFIFVPFMAQAQSLRFNVLLMATLALFPNLVAALGAAPHLNLAVYNAYVWMVYPPVVMILGLIDYLLYRIYRGRERFARQAATDPLTDVPNRRHFLEVGHRLLHLAVRSQEPVSLMFLDADHFKRVNDVHGHAFGDRVLQEMARRAALLVRRSDVLARYGGEEFVILLPGLGAADAAGLAERLREQMAGQPLATDAGEAVTVTVSIGVATAKPGGGRETSLLGLLQEADAALYQAKHAGRNRVVSTEAALP